jgi:serine/threonine protein kinase
MRFLFYFICSHPPFESETQYGIYKKVLAGELTYPKHINDEVKDLLTQLLNPKPGFRLGNLKNGAADVKAHAWFKDLDWKALEGKKLRAPYLPKLKDESDTSNFCKYPDTADVPGEDVSNDVFPEFGPGC